MAGIRKRSEISRKGFIMSTVIIKKYRDDFTGFEVPGEDFQRDPTLITLGYTFSVGQLRFELDATPATVAELNAALHPFMECATVVEGNGKIVRRLSYAEWQAEQAASQALPPIPETPASTNGTNGEPTSAQVREWARSSPEWQGRAEARGTGYRTLRDAYMVAHAQEHQPR